jgi:quercetin dioxygenase-like cupin family protein
MIKMTASKLSTGFLPSGHGSNGGWLQVTPGERFKIRTFVEDTAGAYKMLEVVADSRNGVPVHIHENEDEHFVVLKGTLHIAYGDKRLDVPTGTAISLSKGVPHAWCNLSDDPVRILVVLSPGHIERLFRETAAGGSRDDIAAIATRFGVRITGPALFEDIYSVISPRAWAGVAPGREKS